MPNGKITRWNNDGYTYIGNSLSQVVKLSNYSDISNIDVRLNNLTSNFKLLASLTRSVGTSLDNYSITLPQPIMSYQWILFKVVGSYETNNNNPYSTILPYNMNITYINNSNLYSMLFLHLQNNVGVCRFSELRGYDDSDYYVTLSTNSIDNTNIISWYSYGCNVQVYGSLA